jgi:hypothetical protein
MSNYHAPPTPTGNRQPRRAWLALFFILWSSAAVGHTAVFPKRPIDADGGPTTVYVSAFLLDVDEVNSANQTFTANIFYQLRWNDPRLAHAEDGDRIFPVVDVWNPRVQISNQQRLVRTFPEIVYVSPEGDVSYQQRVWGSFSEPLNLRDFPFDSQEFRFDLVSAGYGPEELEFIPDPEGESGIASELSLPDWDITSAVSDSIVYQHNPAVDRLAGFRVKFHADRQIGYYLLKVILPLILIVVMSWIVFWIDPKESGTQISVSVTSMLTLIAYRFMVGGLLPHISYLTRLDGFILLSTLLVFATLMAVVVTSSLAKSERLETARRVDRVFRVAFPATFFCVLAFAFIF